MCNQLKTNSDILVHTFISDSRCRQKHVLANGRAERASGTLVIYQFVSFRFVLIYAFDSVSDVNGIDVVVLSQWCHIHTVVGHESFSIISDTKLTP